MLIGTSLDARVVSEKPFTRTAGQNTVTKIRVCDNPGRKSDRNPARFFNAEGWGAIGEQLAKLSKGDLVSLTGELKIDKYTDKNGTERTDDVLTVTNFRVQKSDSFFGKAAAPDTTAPDDNGPVADADIPF